MTNEATRSMSFSDTLVGFPLRAILRNALKIKAPRGAAFWIREERVSAVVAAGRRREFVGAVEECAGAPRLLSPPARNVAFGRGDARLGGLESDGRFAMALDHPDAQVSLVQTRNAGAETLGELRKLPIQALLPMSELPEDFAWELLSNGFLRLPDSGVVPSSVLVVGLPKRVCWWAEKWVESVDGVLLSIVPALLAILHWCGRVGSGFVLVPGPIQSHLALFAAGDLVLLSKLPGCAILSGGYVEALIGEIRQEVQLGEGALCVYPGELPSAGLGEFLSRFSERVRVLEAEVEGRGYLGGGGVEEEVLRSLYFHSQQ